MDFGPSVTNAILALDNQLCFALQSAARRMERAYQAKLSAFDLTYPQYLVMLVLWEWEQAENAKPTVRALGERLDLDSGTLTPLLRRMEHKGLVTRTRSNEDGRELFVHVTPRGSALKQPVCMVPMSFLASSPIPLPELLGLRDQLKRLRAGMPSQQTQGE